MSVSSRIQKSISQNRGCRRAGANLRMAYGEGDPLGLPRVMAVRRAIQCSWLRLPRSRVPPIFAFLPCSAAICVPDRASGTTPAANRGRTDMTVSTERAVLAGGCFWGVQDLLRKYPGVISTRVGYSGGEVPNATYRNHGNHAEAVEIVFDPRVIGFRRTLELF